MAKKMHPLVAQALTTVAEVGKKALGRAMDSVLEDAGEAARDMSARAARAQGGFARPPAPQQEVDESVGVGAPKRRKKKKKKVRAKARVHARRRVVGADEEDE